MRTCSACHTSISDEYRYCLNCGKDLGDPVIHSEEPPPTIIYQGPVTTPRNLFPTRSTASRLPWVILLTCGAIIFVLIMVIASRSRTSVSENIPQTEPSPTTELAKTISTTPQHPLSSSSPSFATPEKKTGLQPSSPDSTEDLFEAPKVSPSIVSTPTPSTPTDPNRIYSGREVTDKARITFKPEPVYTEDARANQITGVVVLRVVLTSTGTVEQISVVSGLPYGLTERAIAAARNIRFVPAKKDGVPISMAMQLEYNFNLY